MKLTDLKEMTARTTSMEDLGKHIKEYEYVLNDGTHVGDIEEFKVLRVSRQIAPFYDYILTLEDKIVAFFSVSKKWIVEVAYVIPEYRKKGLFSAFLFFLKRNEGANKITLGNVHSPDTVKVVKRIYKRFETNWENQKSGEKVKFDPNIEEPYYSSGIPTDWKIVLESDYDFTEWPKYREGIENAQIIKSFYFCFLDEED